MFERNHNLLPTPSSGCCNKGQVCRGVAAAWEQQGLTWALSLWAQELQLSSSPSPAHLCSHVAGSGLVLLNWLSWLDPEPVSSLRDECSGTCSAPVLPVMKKMLPCACFAVLILGSLLSTPLVMIQVAKSLSEIPFFSPLYFWVLSSVCDETLGNGGGYPCVIWIDFWGAFVEGDDFFLFASSVILFLKCNLLL